MECFVLVQIVPLYMSLIFVYEIDDSPNYTCTEPGFFVFGGWYTIGFTIDTTHDPGTIFIFITRLLMKQKELILCSFEGMYF